MARYRAVVQGNRGPASRCGSKSSGITATANGWDIGAEIVIRYETERGAIVGRDVVYVYRTGGSNGTLRELVAKFDDGNETSRTAVRASVAVSTEPPRPRPRRSSYNILRGTR